MMQYALFARPVVTIYDLPQTTKQSEAGLVSTIGDEGLYGQACQVRTAPGGVTAEGVPLSPEVAEVVTFYGYHGFVRRDALKFVSEDALRAYLPQPLVLVGRATDVLCLPKVQGVRMLELERGCLLCRLPEPPRAVYRNDDHTPDTGRPYYGDLPPPDAEPLRPPPRHTYRQEPGERG